MCNGQNLKLVSITIAHERVKENENFLVLFATKIVMKINSLSFAHNVLIGYTANVMALQKLSLTFRQRKMMICFFIALFALFKTMLIFYHSVIYLNLKCWIYLLPSYSVRSKLTNLPHLGDFDMDENLVHSIKSKYFEISELNNFRYNVCVSYEH